MLMGACQSSDVQAWVKSGDEDLLNTKHMKFAAAGLSGAGNQAEQGNTSVKKVQMRSPSRITPLSEL